MIKKSIEQYINTQINQNGLISKEHRAFIMI